MFWVVVPSPISMFRKKKKVSHTLKLNLLSKISSQCLLSPVIIREGVCKKLTLAVCINPSQLSKFPGWSSVLNAARLIKTSLFQQSSLKAAAHDLRGLKIHSHLLRSGNTDAWINISRYSTMLHYLFICSWVNL